jgi:hypothetical protein
VGLSGLDSPASGWGTLTGVVNDNVASGSIKSGEFLGHLSRFSRRTALQGGSKIKLYPVNNSINSLSKLGQI